jgi:ferredoxin/flavodoxin---NADP+ reductase
LSLIATGFAQAALAANAAATFVNPEAKLFPGHSSEMRL